jgi:hypothetical protein
MTNTTHDFTPSELSTENQRARLLQHLHKHGELCTITGRESLGIMAVATRVFELRRDGYHIHTVRGYAYDAQGRKHPNAVYLFGGVR